MAPHSYHHTAIPKCFSAKSNAVVRFSSEDWSLNGMRDATAEESNLWIKAKNTMPSAKLQDMIKVENRSPSPLPTGLVTHQQPNTPISIAHQAITIIIITDLALKSSTLDGAPATSAMVCLTQCSKASFSLDFSTPVAAHTSWHSGVWCAVHCACGVLCGHICFGVVWRGCVVCGVLWRVVFSVVLCGRCLVCVVWCDSVMYLQQPARNGTCGRESTRNPRSASDCNPQNLIQSR